MFTFVSTRSGVFDEVRRFDDQGEARRHADRWWDEANHESDDFVVTEYVYAKGTDDQPVVYSPGRMGD